MVEQSYVLASGSYRSWAGFLIRQEGGEWGKLVLVLQRQSKCKEAALRNQSSSPSLCTLMPEAKAACKGERMVLLESKERREKAPGGVKPREHDKDRFLS